jgi:hypothetical protein
MPERCRRRRSSRWAVYTVAFCFRQTTCQVIGVIAIHIVSASLSAYYSHVNIRDLLAVSIKYHVFADEIQQVCVEQVDRFAVTEKTEIDTKKHHY